MTELPQRPVDRTALLAFLEQQGIRTTTHEHPPLFTVEDSRKLRGQIDGGHTKNLFLKDKKGNYFLLTAEESTVINLKTLHKLLGGASRFSFGKPDALMQHLGVIPGAVTAFGIINDTDGAVTFAMDKKLMEYDILNCHPLVNDATTQIARDDLLRFAEMCDHAPMIVDLDAVVE